MNLFFILVYSLCTILKQTCSSDTGLRLEVKPPGLPFGAGPPVLVKSVNESLNLTCRLVNNKQETLPDYNISWNWQYSMGSNANRVLVFSLSRNEANVVFRQLKETDNGEYTCKCAELDLSTVIRVKVRKFRDKTCGENSFLCPSGTCIAKRFVCDGKQDCKDGSDESYAQCGPNPCEGKIPCENHRCIPVTSCCDRNYDINCTIQVRPDCCPPLIKPYLDQDSSITDQHYSDMGFLQTTIYTVIGCAMAFMFIVTILVIAICRVHIKRTIVTRCPLNHQHLRPGSPWRPALPLYDLDMFLERHDALPHSGLLVTYNINNGVQFVGRPIDPPPYCEIVETPPREGPPPPYVSRENLGRSTESSSTCSRGCGRSTDTESSADIYTVDSSRDIGVCSDPNVSVHTVSQLFNRRIKFSSLDNVRLGLPKPIRDLHSDSTDCYSSNPSVSGASQPKSTDSPRKDGFYSEVSDTESETSYMENDALLVAGVEEVKAQADLEDVAATKIVAATKRSRLITQKSFDGCNRDIVLANARNDTKNTSLTTHSMCDLSPLSSDLRYGDFGDREYLTLPLRESFIGICKDEV